MSWGVYSPLILLINKKYFMYKEDLLKQDLVYENELNILKTRNVTNSLLVAKKFEKRHDHVLRDIKELQEEITSTQNWGDLYCEEITYKDTYGRDQKAYEFNRDFFTLLVMGFTGTKALQFKIEYINKFNLMEQELLRRRETRQIGKTIERKELTNFIEFVNGNEENDFVKWSYKLYTDIVYKIVFKGQTAKEKRIELNLKDNQNLRDFLTYEELQQVQYWEKYIKNIAIKNNWHKLSSKDCYKKVKEFIKSESIN